MSSTDLFSLLKKPTASAATIAKAVKKLSDFFIQHPDQKTPWADSECQLAYRYYFLPLNYIRNQNVILRGQDVGFFNHINHTVDWGCGPGTASLALSLNLKQNLKKQILIDISPSVEKYFSDLKPLLQQPHYSHQLTLPAPDSQQSLLVFSYSLTEMRELPSQWDKYSAVMILEPSTSDDGRHLLQIRDQLIKQNYFIWAPCPHQLSCPLFTQSKTDWCHDRFHVRAPEWFSDIEKLLPFKNKTITTSYLLARKNPMTIDLRSKARLVGDSMNEKGKTRQLICRGTEREFLTWMHKEITPETLDRGLLIDMPEAADYEIKSNEIRLKKPIIRK